MASLRPTEEERAALCEWLTANGVDINTVPIESSFSIVEEADGQRLIHYTQFVRDENTGNILADPDGGAMERSASTPCTVEPPSWLNIPGGGG
jgi:hypothetical protein